MSFEFIAVEAEDLETGERARHTFEVRASADPTERRANLEELATHAYPHVRFASFDCGAARFVDDSRAVTAWVIEPEVVAAPQDQLFAA